MPAPISIVIPTLNAADELPETCASLLEGATEGLVRELIVSDGGSEDPTKRIAAELGARWTEGPSGRGGQIRRGAELAKGEWILILHADTHLSPGWANGVRQHMESLPDCAGYFRLSFRAAGLAPRLVASGANLRARAFGLPYGDQGLLVSRALLDDVGGVPDIPLMEDVALARGLKGRLRPLDGYTLTSAERYVRDGWTRRVRRNLGTLARYLIGVPPEKLVTRYGSPHRRSSEKREPGSGEPSAHGSD